MRQPRKGYRWIKIEALTLSLVYVGQLWYEANELWRPTDSEINSAVAQHFPLLHGHFKTERLNSAPNAIQPIELIRYHYASTNI